MDLDHPRAGRNACDHHPDHDDCSLGCMCELHITAATDNIDSLMQQLVPSAEEASE
jgi:hypothetical protein